MPALTGRPWAGEPRHVFPSLARGRPAAARREQQLSESPAIMDYVESLQRQIGRRRPAIAAVELSPVSCSL